MTDAINQATTFLGNEPGPSIVILGAVHGNETCGTTAIRQTIAAINEHKITVKRGRLTFVPVTNPLAYQHKRRIGDRNLNRMLTPYADPQTFEDHIANWLCPILADHDVLLDLHSFQGKGQPFVMVGPLNNQGDVEPFRFAAEEEALARAVGVQRAVDGWLSTYDTGTRRRQALGAPNQNALYGVGTTEYMRSQGGYGVTLECGQHLDPMAPLVAYRAIVNTLTHLDLIDQTVTLPKQPMESLRLYEVVDKMHAEDRFVQQWSSFDPVHSGQTIAIRHDGTTLTAPHDGYVVFPDSGAQVGAEWFYLAQFSDRFSHAAHGHDAKQT